MRAVKATGVMRTVRSAGLVLAMVAAGIGLLPAAAHAAAGDDVKVSSLTGVTAAATTPSGGYVYAATSTTQSHSNGTTTVASPNVTIWQLDSTQSSTTRPTVDVPLSYTFANGAKASLLAMPVTGYSSGPIPLVVIANSGATWYLEVLSANPGTGTLTDTGISGSFSGSAQAVAVSADGADAYVLRTSGEIDAVSLTTGTATVVTTVGHSAGGFALSPSSTSPAIYAGIYDPTGTTPANVGAIETIPLTGDTVAGTPSFTPLGSSASSTTPLALTADAAGDVYVAAAAGMAELVHGATYATGPDLSTAVGDVTTATPGVPVSSYPISSLVCGSLALDSPASPAYLYCGPSRTSDGHLYRFDVNADGVTSATEGLTSAVGIPTSAGATAVWSHGSGNGVYALIGATASFVDSGYFSTTPEYQTFPQPPQDVEAASQMTDTSGSTVPNGTVVGIHVQWIEPALDASDVTGYSVTATFSGKVMGSCGNGTNAIYQVAGSSPAEYECVIPGLTAAKAYTIAVSSTNGYGASTPVYAPATVNAGTPGPTIAATGTSGTACSDPSIPAGIENSGYIVPTYTLPSSASGTPTSVTVSWPVVSSDTCDPFTGEPLSFGVGATTGGSTAGGVSYYVLSAIDSATGKAITADVATATATGATAPHPSADSPSVTEMTSSIPGLTAGHSYVFTVAANNSPSSFNAAYTGVATYAVPDTRSGTTGTVGGSAVPAMDPVATDTTWDYVGGAYFPADYASQADRYQSALYIQGSAAWSSTASPIDPSYAVAEPAPPLDASIAVQSLSSSLAVTWAARANYADHVAWGLQDVTGYTATASYTDQTGKTTTKSCSTTGYATTGCTITGLTNGTPYLVTVQAKGGALGPAGEYVGGGSTPVSVTPYGYPAAPTTVTTAVPGITVSAKPWGQIKVGWTPPKDDGGSAITAYQIVATPADPTVATPVTGYVTTDSSLATTLGISSVASLPTTYTFPQSSLSSQTTWSFTVAAHNAYLAVGQTPEDSWGPFSSASSRVQPNGAPLPPTTVKATVTPTSLTASWVAPKVTGGWPLAGYLLNVYDMTNPNGTGLNVQPNATLQCPGVATSCTFADLNGTSLPNGDQFYVTVQAYNQDSSLTTVLSGAPTPDGLTSGQSAPSNTVGKYGQPASPTAVTATPGNASIFVTWTPSGSPSTPSAATGQGVLTGYTATATAGAVSKSCTAVPPATSCNITGLTNGTAYTVGVTESNPGAASLPGYYADSGGALPVTPGTVPAAPASVTADAGDQSVSIWWTAPKTNGGAIVTQYVATVLPGGESCTVAMPAATTCSVAGLADGTTYTVSVVASNSFGDGTASAAVTFTPKGVPAAPTAVQAYPEDGSATVMWDAPTDDGGSPITGYQAVAQPSTPGQGKLQSCTSTTPSTSTTSKASSSTPAAPIPLTCTITGLTDGAQYTVYVVAISAAGQGAKSAPSTPFTPIGAPDAPTGVVAYTDLGGPTTGETTLHIGWTAPDNDGGSPIETYTATASNGQTCVVAGSSTSCDIVGLRAGVKYTVKVIATNADGYLSPASAASAPSSPAGPPSVPKHVVAVANQNAITVSWTKARSNGAKVTQYVLTLEPTGQVIYVNGSRTSAVITGLEPGQAYRVVVEAESGPTLVSGTSRLSNQARPFTRPNRMAKPRAKVVRTGRTFKVVLAWAAPRTNGARITAYVVRRVGGRARTVNAKVHRVVFTGLRRNRTYAFSVAAVNVHGTGSASPSVVVKTHG